MVLGVLENCSTQAAEEGEAYFMTGSVVCTCHVIGKANAVQCVNGKKHVK